MPLVDVKMRGDANGILIPARMGVYDGRIFFDFKYSVYLKDEIKAMEGACYHGFDGATYRQFCKDTFGKDQIWSVEKNSRNNFQLQYLFGGDPYAPWDAIYEGKRHREQTRDHQWELASHILAVHYGLWGAEMGVGKTLAWIEAMEHSVTDDWWYVGPKSAIAAVERELRHWDSKIIPKKMMTYQGLKKIIDNWKDTDEPPHGICFDESSRLKTLTSQTSQAARIIADAIRIKYGFKSGYVLEMTGSPAPKNPSDWYSQCEIAAPGFIREGTLKKFTQRLAVCESKEGVAGQQYTKITWLDNPDKCLKCGELKDGHDSALVAKGIDAHEWVPSKDEVSKLYGRLKGLVKIKLKKDCLQLPEKVYQRIKCPIDADTARAAKLIVASTPRAAEALILLRELSDGFQYEEEADATNPTKVCPLCFGQKILKSPVIKAGHDPENPGPDSYEYLEVPCDQCKGTGDVPNLVRTVRRVDCPKDDALLDLIDLHGDVGRMVIYAGFTASIDRVEDLCQSQKWATIRFDGRGIKILDKDGSPLIGRDFLEIFQKGQEEFPKLAFIGQPGAAGMGLTLTASPSITYFSNDFKLESRIQSEDRIHRFGCTGANIYDLCHLPTDYYILDNLQLKKNLQALTMGDIAQCMGITNKRLF